MFEADQRDKLYFTNKKKTFPDPRLMFEITTRMMGFIGT